MTKPVLLPLDTLNTHSDFSFRGWHYAAHVRDLRQVLTSNPRKFLDPLIVWKDPKDGKLFILDGHYRAEAYRAARQGTRKVPVRFFEGSKEDAVLTALRANSKAKLPLTSQERQDAAWRLVRLPQAASGVSYSKSTIANASGVSERLVGYMRVRWKEVQLQGQEPLTGRWLQDRGRGISNSDYISLNEHQREQQIKTLSREFRDLTDRRKRGGSLPILGDQDAVYEAFSLAYGDVWVKGFFSFVLGDCVDEWTSDFPLAEALDGDEDDPPF